MADVGKKPMGPGRGPSRSSPQPYVPSHEAVTAPLPRVDADGLPWQGGKRPHKDSAADGAETLLVSPSAGASGTSRPGGAGERPGVSRPGAGRETLGVPGTSPQPPAPPPGGWASVLPSAMPAEARGVRKVLRVISAIPFRVVYGVITALVTAGLVLAIFALFSGDEFPDGTEQPVQASVERGVTPSPAPSSVKLPKVPADKAPPTYDGRSSVVIGLIADPKARISYGRLARPWREAEGTSFSVAQRIGTLAEPYTIIASGRVPGSAPKSLKSEADLRKVAVSAVRWSIRRYHPAGSKVTWTGSQPLATGKGWVLFYEVRYEIDGDERVSQAAMAVVDTGAKKPSMLFVTIADTHRERWADIVPLMSAVRAY